ncbi:MAG: DUF5661 family protein [Candidatus Pacearchaeota archaeon]
MNKTDKTLAQLLEDFQLDVPLEEFKMGIQVEKEHTESGPRKGMYAVIPNKLLFIARIAAAHLAELPDYYTRLKEMEAQGKKEASTSSGDVVNENGSTHEEVLHRTGKPFEDSRLDKLRSQMSESLNYLQNKLIPESKKHPKVFSPLKEFKEVLETTILTLDEVLLAFKENQ